MTDKHIINKPNCISQIEEIFDSELFRLLSEPVRCDLIKFLALNGPSDISTIADNFKQDRSVISRHLHQMYKSGILNMTKESRYTIYQLNAHDLLNKFEAITEKIRMTVNTYCDN